MKARGQLLLRAMARASMDSGQLRDWCRVLQLPRKSLFRDLTQLTESGYLRAEHKNNHPGGGKVGNPATYYSLSRKGRKVVSG